MTDNISPVIKLLIILGVVKILPQISQYRSAKSVLQVLEKLTYQKFGGLEELDVMAERVDNEIHG